MATWLRNAVGSGSSGGHSFINVNYEDPMSGSSDEEEEEDNNDTSVESANVGNGEMNNRERTNSVDGGDDIKLGPSFFARGRDYEAVNVNHR